MLKNDNLAQDVRVLCDKRGVKGGVSIALLSPESALDLAVGSADNEGNPLTPRHWLQHASLSKSVAAVFAVQHFAAKGYGLDTRVNDLFARETTSDFRLVSADGCPTDWCEAVQLRHLINHSGCDMHYVHGIQLEDDFPPVLQLIRGDLHERYGYEKIEITKEPGTRFGYSGGGFLVLQHLLECMEGAPIETIMRPFLDSVGLSEFSFDACDTSRSRYAMGFMDDGAVVGGGGGGDSGGDGATIRAAGRLAFPPLAAGGSGTPRALANFFATLIGAYHDPRSHSPISHATARAVLHDNVEDLGSVDFMNASMGLGVFVTSAGPNRVAVHQAANEGFRGVYVFCFEGPDAGKGMVVLSNGDNNSAVLNAEVLGLLLRRWAWQGVDVEMLAQDAEFAFQGIPQEQIVNLAYKTLVFNAFQPAQ